jgi:hypothetical protein
LALRQAALAAASDPGRDDSVVDELSNKFRLAEGVRLRVRNLLLTENSWKKRKNEL